MKNAFQPKVNSTNERDWLIENHRPMVFHLAKKISNNLAVKTDTEDLVAYGQIGLVEAADRFDASRGNKFSTFAYYRIRGAIYDGLREMGVITRSRTHRFAANADDLLMSEADDATVSSGTASTAEDDIKSVENVIDALLPIYFLSIDEENAHEIRDERQLASEDFENKELLELVRAGLNKLDPEEAGLLKKIYFKKILMKDVGLEMGITKSWVSRLHARAIRHLQDVLREQGVLTSG